MAELQKFVMGFHNQLMVVHGKPGDGKSALLSHFCANFAEKNPRTFVLPHFISVSPGSTGNFLIIFFHNYLYHTCLIPRDNRVLFLTC